MDPSISQPPESDDETKDLQCLLDVFGSQCSLEEIASAYCRAKGNVNTAGGLLSERQRDVPNVGTGSKQSKDPSEDDWTHNLPKYPRRSKKLTVSTGIVPNVVGKGLMSSRLPPSGSTKTTKPLKLQLEQPDLMSDAHAAAVVDFVPTRKELSNTDVEEFLFSMLQEGFKLDRSKIQEVLGSCGYDAKKSMEELFEVSSPDVVKGEEMIDNLQKNPADKLSEMESHLSEEICPKKASSQRVKSCPLGDVSTSVLQAIFANSKGPEEPPKRVRLKPGFNRRSTVGRTVVSAPPAIDIEKISTFQERQYLKEGKEDDYDILRSAAKQHWNSMKAYYEAVNNLFYLHLFFVLKT